MDEIDDLIFNTSFIKVISDNDTFARVIERIDELRKMGSIIH